MKKPIHTMQRAGWLAVLALFPLLIPAQTAAAQSISLGADLVSRYIWRGTDFGESASVQPAATFSAGGFEIGAWGSYGIAPDAGDANEADLWAGYSIPTETAGTFGLGVTDYYFPNAGFSIFDFDGDGEGAHWIEPYLSYSGPDSFPISLFGGIFVHNDPDNSIYLEASYPIDVNGVELGLTAGASATESAFYSTNKFTFINLGVSVARAIPITDTFELPVSVAYIVNPNPSVEKGYLVFGLSLGI